MESVGWAVGTARRPVNRQRLVLRRGVMKMAGRLAVCKRQKVRGPHPRCSVGLMAGDAGRVAEARRVRRGHRQTPHKPVTVCSEKGRHENGWGGWRVANVRRCGGRTLRFITRCFKSFREAQEGKVGGEDIGLGRDEVEAGAGEAEDGVQNLGGGGHPLFEGKVRDP